MPALSFDERKDELNRQKHGFSLADAIAFDWTTAFVREDTRYDYPERRFQAIGQLDEGLVVFLVIAREPKPFRPISLRLAERHEVAAWFANQMQKQTT